ncbi:MAG: hypothetical protein D6740_07870 [Alphaproteobacteria bacterium]|nr:MAG: hypothetical protein D6740_07870 [Alphaproteobacteria bacterium]
MAASCHCRRPLVKKEGCPMMLLLPATVQQVAGQLGVWERIETALAGCTWRDEIASLPVRPSRAATRLGSYQQRGGSPRAILLQPVLEPELLRETFLHEVAHACDHRSNQPGQVYRRPHGAGWRDWMARLGCRPEVRGHSATLALQYVSRLKTVAVCSRCGSEVRRLRRLNRRARYLHAGCGGRLKPV